METQKLLFDTRVNVFLRGHGLTFPGGLRAESSDPVPKGVPEMGADRLRLLSVPDGWLETICRWNP